MPRPKKQPISEPAAVPAPWRNRIIGYGEEAPDQLLANPFNFRIHSHLQEKALSGVLHDIGFVQNVLVNQTTGHMIDGHLRVQMAISEGQPTVPVTYLDLTEEEEKVIIATFDPISAMAGKDEAIWQDLVGGMDEAMRALVDKTRAESAPTVDLNTDQSLQEKTCKCPECGFEFSVGVAA